MDGTRNPGSGLPWRLADGMQVPPVIRSRVGNLRINGVLTGARESSTHSLCFSCRATSASGMTRFTTTRFIVMRLVDNVFATYTVGVVRTNVPVRS